VEIRSTVLTRIYSRVKRSPFLRAAALRTASSLRGTAALGRRLLDPGYRPPEVIGVLDSLVANAEGTELTPPIETTIWKGRPSEQVANEIPHSVEHIFDDQYRPLAASVPPSFVLELEDARVVGDGVILTSEGLVIHQVSKPIGSMRSYMAGWSDAEVGHFDVQRHLRAPARRLAGTTVVLSTFAGRGYYHWLFDVLARLAPFQDAGFSLDEVDHFVVNNYSAGYQVETLRQFGIDRRRVVTSFRFPHIQADRLLVPSLAREGGVNPRWSCEFINAAFPPVALPTRLQGVRRVYVSRGGTDHGRVAAEETVVGLLRRRGFVPVLLEELSMGEKATLFSQADAVIGASGAGLTNLVFCRPGTKVIDICTRGYALLDAWDIANRVGVEYWYTTDGVDHVTSVLDGAGIT
jgi:capsular polysaccharide biosynthesis protein